MRTYEFRKKKNIIYVSFVTDLRVVKLKSQGVYGAQFSQTPGQCTGLGVARKIPDLIIIISRGIISNSVPVQVYTGSCFRNICREMEYSENGIRIFFRKKIPETGRWDQWHEVGDPMPGGGGGGGDGGPPPSLPDPVTRCIGHTASQPR